MKINNFVDVIYTHTDGSPTCIVYGGITFPGGSDIMEKRKFIEENYDYLRKMLMHEPRGHHDMYGVFLTPSSKPDIDAGMIWMDGDHFMHMCGHGTIGVAMAMVSYGMVKPTPPKNIIKFETTAGIVTAEVQLTDTEVKSCKFHNVPAFLEYTDVEVELGQYGKAYADISFGGNYFALIKWENEKIKINPENASIFRELGIKVKRDLNKSLKLKHPENPYINKIDVVTFYHDAEQEDAMYRNIHIFADGQVGRSTGGTGVSAMLAMLEGKGKIKKGQTVKGEGPLGGIFEGQVIGSTMIGEQRAVMSTVEGTANIYGYAKWLLDKTDPIGRGFLLG